MNPLIIDSALSDSRKPVIVALDFADEASTIQFVRRLDPSLCRLKIGKELFTATGRRLAENLIHQGYQLFLDLKYHDIPNTVAKACKAAAEMGVWMVDMHASGGRRMMEAAAEAMVNCPNKPLLIGVTVLTSMEQADLLKRAWMCRLRSKCCGWRGWRKVRAWTAWSAPHTKPPPCAARSAPNLSW